MSISHIKELLCKRISDADNQNLISVQCSATNASAKKQDLSANGKKIFESLTEADACITEYLCKKEGFCGIIKERFSDFQVHEIDLDGNVVALTHFDIPINSTPALDIPDDILDNSVWEQLKELEENKDTTVEIDVTDCDKDRRRDIHKLIKAKYRNFTTNSVMSDKEGEKKCIVVTHMKDKRDSWPSQCGHYLHFVMFKENLDTMTAINKIASKLCVKVSKFTYAGTKDKRGKTSQWVSMWHLRPERLNSLNNCFKNIKVGNFIYKKQQLKLGDLKGNHFRVALRNVTADAETIDGALNSLKENGFINYFGLQRFGNCPEVPTFKIGKSLLKGEFKEAVELILKPRDEKSDKDGLQEARRIWWETRDAKRAYGSLRSKNRTYEGKLLLGLATHGKKAYVNALECIPRNVRLLYLHSYQSLLWNKIVSRRIQEFGPKVLEGDLIWTKNEINEEVSEMEQDDNVSDTSSGSEPVRFITADEVDKYEIFDIVHPLPGFNAIYPNNIIKIWYEDLLKEEGLTTEEFKQKVKEYSLSGTYRNIIKKVKDLTWEVVHYSTPEDDLILSDIEKIEGKTLEIGNQGTGKYRAVVMNFVLDSSTYATMAIREVLKIDTSSSYQASLNTYSSKRKLDSDDEDMKKKIKT